MNNDETTILCEATPEQLDRVRAAVIACGHPSLNEAVNGDGGSAGFWNWTVARVLDHFAPAAMDDETLARMTDTYFIARVREDGSWDVIREIAAKDDDEANAIAERECDGDDWYVLTRRGGKLVNINGGVDG